jgi:cytochrome c-type biogenesis protein CcmF
VVSFVAATIFIDFGKVSSFWAKRNQVHFLKGLTTAFSKNQRRYAGLVTHFGVLVLIMGIIASTIYQTEKVVPMKIGDQLQLKQYTLTMVDLREVQGPNWTAQEGAFDVYRGETFITTLHPQKRIYPDSQTPTTESAIYTIRLGHLFLTMPEISPEGVIVRALVNPLVLLVWIGGGIMGLGVLLNIFRPRREPT